MTGENRQRIVRVSRQLLVGILKFPDGTRLVDVSCLIYFDQDQLALKIEHPDFTPVEPGHVIPEITAEYRSTLAAGPQYVPEFVGFRDASPGVVVARPMTPKEVEDFKAALEAIPSGEIVSIPNSVETRIPTRGREFL